MKKRSKKIMDSMRGSLAKNAKANIEKMSKKRKKRPWSFVIDGWMEEVWRVFGKDVRDMSKKCTSDMWGPAEKALLRKYISESGDDIDTVVRSTNRFISWWYEKGKEGLPSFKYFWSMRHSFETIVDGSTKETISERRRRSQEYDESNDGVQGWGDALDESSEKDVSAFNETVSDAKKRAQEYDKSNDGVQGWGDIFGV